MDQLRGVEQRVRRRLWANIWLATETTTKVEPPPMPVELVKLHAKFPGPPPLSEVADQVVVGEAERDRQAHCEAQRARNSAKRATTCTKAHDEEAAQRRKQQSQSSNVWRPAVEQPSHVGRRTSSSVSPSWPARRASNPCGRCRRGCQTTFWRARTERRLISKNMGRSRKTRSSTLSRGAGFGAAASGPEEQSHCRELH